MLYIACEADAGTRLDTLVARAADISRSAAVRLIEGGLVTVGGAPLGKKYAVCSGDAIEVTLPEPEEYSVEPEDIPLDVVYEDDAIIVINKPSGMVVHPAPGNYSGTLVNALLHHCRGSLSGIGGVMRPGIVHRIDKDTSGLLVVAKSDAAHARLSEELSYHGIEREYRALVRGGFKTESGTVDLPIGRHPTDRKKMAVITERGGARSRSAVTHYEVLASYGQISYLSLRLETGRTHQIRVHMSHLGHPLLGDEVYGPSANSAKTALERKHPELFCGQMLHAKRLMLTHPVTGVRMEFECEEPANFKSVLFMLEHGS